MTNENKLPWNFIPSGVSERKFRLVTRHYLIEEEEARELYHQKSRKLFNGSIVQLSKEILNLKKENQQLQEENKILKDALNDL